MKNLNRNGRAALLLLVASVVSAVPITAQEVPATGRVITLEEAVRTAIEQNRDLQGARLALEGAEAQVREAWGNVYPSVDMNATYTRNLEVPVNFLPKRFVDPNAGPDELVGIRFGTDNQWYGQVRVEQPIFQAAAFIGVGAAGRYRALQEEMVRGTAQAVVTRTRLAYYDVLLAQEALRLNENSVRRVRQTLEETRALYRAGVASEYDVLRLEVELGNLEPALRRAQNAAVAARRSLAVELGIADGDAIRVTGSLATMEVGDGEPAVRAADESTEANQSILAFGGLPSPETVSAAEAVQIANQRRSDLRQLELSKSLRMAELRVEQSEYLPKISLFGTYSMSAQQDGSPDFFGSSQNRFNGQAAGIMVSMPLFSGLQRPARVAQKKAALRQVQTQARQASAQVENGVRTLLDAVHETRDRADAQRRAVNQAARGFEIARVQYREGVGSQLEVTDAEVALRQSEFNYAQAVYDYLTARARLDEAIGMVPGTAADLDY